MAFTKYNLKKIVRINLTNKKVSKYAEFRNEIKPKKFLGIKYSIGQKEGFYSRYFMKEYLGCECPEQHQLVDGICYEDYKLTISFEGGIEFNEWFKTHEEAFVFANNVIKTSGEQHILEL